MASPLLSNLPPFISCAAYRARVWVRVLVREEKEGKENVRGGFVRGEYSGSSKHTRRYKGKGRRELLEARGGGCVCVCVFVWLEVRVGG